VLNGTRFREGIAKAAQAVLRLNVSMVSGITLTDIVHGANPGDKEVSLG
jgi:hypothetical protein